MQLEFSACDSIGRKTFKPVCSLKSFLPLKAYIASGTQLNWVGKKNIKKVLYLHTLEEISAKTFNPSQDSAVLSCDGLREYETPSSGNQSTLMISTINK